MVEWIRAIKSQLEKYCPHLTSKNNYGYLSPSFAGVSNHLNPVKTFADGLDADKDIKLISIHK